MLEIRNITKVYGSLRALDDVSFDIQKGEIHAVLGENGAGKSTLMAVLSGFVVPNRGTLSEDGVRVPFGNPAKVKRLGIEMVHQHFTLVPAFSVAENIALFRARNGRGRSNATDVATDLGWNVDRSAIVRSLPVGAQQRVEILKALDANARILILDEPTAVLSQSEIEDLFRALRELKRKGMTVILIAHKLSEIIQIADTATVLRKGKLVATAAVKDVDARKLAEWMVGGMPEALQKPSVEGGPPALHVKDLRVRGNRKEEAVRGVSLVVGRGEILGIGGVDGNGQIELAEALAQVRPSARGEIAWLGQPLGKSPVTLGYIPQDRQGEGLALTMSVLDNLLIAGHRKPELRKGPFLAIGKIKSWARNLISLFNIAVSSVADPAGSLSGGNQQKVVVARTLESLPELLIAVNPTRGLDLQATSYVHRQLFEAKKGGAAILLFSTDLDELAEVADRTVFMSGGRIAEGTDAASFAGAGP